MHANRDETIKITTINELIVNKSHKYIYLRPYKGISGNDIVRKGVRRVPFRWTPLYLSIKHTYTHFKVNYLKHLQYSIADISKKIKKETYEIQFKH